MQRCNKCSKESQDDANFCYSCGNQFRGTNMVDRNSIFTHIGNGFFHQSSMTWQITAWCFLIHGVALNIKVDVPDWMKAFLFGLMLFMTLVFAYSVKRASTYMHILVSRIKNEVSLPKLGPPQSVPLLLVGMAVLTALDFLVLYHYLSSYNTTLTHWVLICVLVFAIVGWARIIILENPKGIAPK